MLILQPIGGLCNRMRSINSARILAEKRGEKLTVIWFNNHELGADFEDIFEKTDAFKIINISSKFSPLKMFYQGICRLFGNTVGNEDIRNNRADGFLNDDYRSSLKKLTYIATEEHFYPSNDYSPFVPIRSILSSIEEISKAFTPSTVGIHIRRTDNMPSKDKSSTDAFITSMEAVLKKDPDATFYLATDDMNEEARLRERFGDKIISNKNRDLSRASVNGIRDALIDLFCLSRTSAIIGSYFSSFTDTAAAMHGIPLTIAGEQEII